MSHLDKNPSIEAAAADLAGLNQLHGEKAAVLAKQVIKSRPYGFDRRDWFYLAMTGFERPYDLVDESAITEPRPLQALDILLEELDSAENGNTIDCTDINGGRTIGELQFSRVNRSDYMASPYLFHIKKQNRRIKLPYMMEGSVQVDVQPVGIEDGEIIFGRAEPITLAVVTTTYGAAEGIERVNAQVGSVTIGLGKVAVEHGALGFFLERFVKPVK